MKKGKRGNTDRCERIARYVIETGSTVRSASNYFGISKSTVHKDLTERLEGVNRSLYLQVRKILDKNKAERHLRGGEATRQKYKKEKGTSLSDFSDFPSFSS